MLDTHAVWRTLADAALAGRRTWDSARDLALDAGVGERLAYKAVARLVEIGAVRRLHPAGFVAVDPETITMMIATARTHRDATRTTVTAAQELMARAPTYVVGGSAAAKRHLGGRVVFGSPPDAIVYLPEGFDIGDLPAPAAHVGLERWPERGVLIHTANADTLAAWHDGYTSPSQTYADLFAQPGWQASEVRRELWKAWWTVDDWSRAEEGLGWIMVEGDWGLHARAR